MAELTISPDEIRSALDEFVSSYQPAAASMTEVGVVATSGDGIARVEGLPSAMAVMRDAAAAMAESWL